MGPSLCPRAFFLGKVSICELVQISRAVNSLQLRAVMSPETKTGEVILQGFHV